jgi:hypothetical protein
MKKLTWSQVSARRLARHGLAVPLPPNSLAKQVAVMCGAHAQVMVAGELSIGLRVEGTTRDTIADALWKQHSLIKTYGPRGTVHMLAADDLAIWMGALAARVPASNSLAPEIRLTEDQIDQIVAAIADALADAELTIDELTDAIVERAGAWAGEKVMPAFQDLWPRWRQIMDIAAYRGALCFGPTRGRKVTYTNPRRWIADFEPADPQMSLKAVLRRYLHAYGPATPQHFAQWMAAPKGWASPLFTAMGDELERVSLDGIEAWVLAGDTDVPDEPPRGLLLLPYFDAFVVGSHPRELLFSGKAAERALAGGQAGNFPVVLIDGVVSGVWHQRRSGKHIDITVEPLDKLTRGQRSALDEQVERVATFLGGTPRLTIGKVNVGPHA